MHHSQSIAVTTNSQFELDYLKKIQLLLMTEPVNRGSAHAMSDDTTSSTHELSYLTESFFVGDHAGAWSVIPQPNLPWAEDHFQERVSGIPLNPPPQEANWPFARKGNEEHKDETERFSHTYPERFWPRKAGQDEVHELKPIYQFNVNFGIRYEYGDLNDLVTVLAKNPRSRQAYLPVWFPEDLTAARQGLRVPCSMGYHFIYNASTRQLDCVYTMRSCDIVRFYRDDIYMAGRLLQWVAEATDQQAGKLVVHIDNLHCFPGDRPFLEGLLANKRPVASNVADRRANYNFGAMG